MPSQSSAEFALMASGRLKRVTLILTNRCNFNCEYCISRVGRGGHQDLSAEEAIKAIDFAKQMDDPNLKIRFTGGEPTLHREFESILAHAVQSGLPVEILTNGTFFPHDPKEFAAKMKKCFPVKKRSAFMGSGFPNIVFFVSVDPVHFSIDPHLKERLFLFGNFLWENGCRRVSNHLRINVRGNFKYDVRKLLRDSSGVGPTVVKALGGQRKLEKFLHSYNWSPDVYIESGESIIRVGGARTYVPSDPNIRVRDFDVRKEIVAGLNGTDIAINPKGNAFASVYSAYENMQPETRTPRGEPHERPYRVTFLGNVDQHGMDVIAGTLMRRRLRWAEYEQSGEHPGYNKRDLADYSRRQELQKGFARFLKHRLQKNLSPSHNK